MTLRLLFGRHSVRNISRLSNRVLLSQTSDCRCIATTTTFIEPLYRVPGSYCAWSFANGLNNQKFRMTSCRYVHNLQVNTDDSKSDVESELENDATMNEFLSRFVWIMRKKLSEAYLDCDKNTIDGMLVVIVGKVVSEMEMGGPEQLIGSSASVSSEDFSEDLWKTVWDVSNVVLQDMEKEKKKEKMKSFLQSEEVKEMYRFAGEVGVRGDMLRELRFKWARQKMEVSEFYESLERLVKEEAGRETSEKEQSGKEIIWGEEGVGDNNNNNADEGEQKIVSLPKRHGKIKYNIYGLDLSDPKWAEVADKIHESGKIMWPEEPKTLSGKSKLVTEKILSLQKEDDPAPLLDEWVELVQPSRIDWINLLDRVRDINSHLYHKIAELVLVKKSFQANVRDYSRLIDSLARENHLEDAERILKMMNENGILPDVIVSTIVVEMYCKMGNLDQAKEAFDRLIAQGFQPSTKLYNSMIMACVNAGEPRLGQSLLRIMESRDIKPMNEIYMALLQSFVRCGDAKGATDFSRIMKGANLHPSFESCKLLVEAYSRAGDSDNARETFDELRKLGHKPDDGCTANLIAAYEKENKLDHALEILLELEKDGFEPGVATYTVLVDWLSMLGLYDEAEQVLVKIAELGEAPSVKLQISLCDMYIKTGVEKKALQSLGVLESKFEQLESTEFERIIRSLISGGFVQDARRMHGLMERRGFRLSSDIKVSLMASQTMGKGNRNMKSSLSKDM